MIDIFFGLDGIMDAKVTLDWDQNIAITHAEDLQGIRRFFAFHEVNTFETGVCAGLRALSRQYNTVPKTSDTTTNESR